MVDLLGQAADAFTNDPWIAIGNVIALSYIIPLVTFIVQYARHSPWWLTDLGVALMAQKIAFALVFVLIDIGIFFHDWPGRAALRVVLYSAVALSLWLDQANLNRYQRRYVPLNQRPPRPSLWRIIRAQFTGEDLTR